MELHVIETGYFKLDGGAMFGVVPKQMWSKINPPDDNNMCTWALRCLLVKDGDRVILIDSGMGNKQDEKFRSHFEPHGEATLISSIKKAGYAPEEITDVLLTHLHFDHVGGAVYRNKDQELVPTFPNATYWSSEDHFNWAIDPNYREKASFLKENFVPLKEQGKLKYMPVENGIHFSENITLDFYNGHTEALMAPTISLPDGKKIVFTSDLLPSSGHVRMPYVMSYDIRPLVTLKEKAKFYEKALDDNTYIFFEHDRLNVLGQLTRNDRGRYGIKLISEFDGLNGL
ncbi:MAG: MBL fold metallo-hydrolase [Saprospiraceae bacterium]|nr:MBL fold metallo-hydrolase [Bacteroidia bacterium]NNL92612.1 MBL fold metallo-hydrolase [Saprospiraceae bacterium]